ncbi:unnamed protein product, partial [Aphanomyces euteiches]
MRIVTPLLAATAVVAFNQESTVNRALEEPSRRLPVQLEGNFERKTRQGCEAEGGFCGKVLGAASAGTKTLLSGRSSSGLSMGKRVKLAGGLGAVSGKIQGKHIAGKWGAAAGKL